MSPLCQARLRNGQADALDPTAPSLAVFLDLEIPHVQLCGAGASTCPFERLAATGPSGQGGSWSRWRSGSRPGTFCVTLPVAAHSVPRASVTMKPHTTSPPDRGPGWCGRSGPCRSSAPSASARRGPCRGSPGRKTPSQHRHVFARPAHLAVKFVRRMHPGRGQTLRDRDVRVAHHHQERSPGAMIARRAGVGSETSLPSLKYQ